MGEFHDKTLRLPDLNRPRSSSTPPNPSIATGSASRTTSARASPVLVQQHKSNSDHHSHAHFERVSSPGPLRGHGSGRNAFLPSHLSNQHDATDFTHSPLSHSLTSISSRKGAVDDGMSLSRQGSDVLLAFNRNIPFLSSSPSRFGSSPSLAHSTANHHDDGGRLSPSHSARERYHSSSQGRHHSPRGSSAEPPTSGRSRLTSASSITVKTSSHTKSSSLSSKPSAHHLSPGRRVASGRSEHRGSGSGSEEILPAIVGYDPRRESINFTNYQVMIKPPALWDPNPTPNRLAVATEPSQVLLQRLSGGSTRVLPTKTRASSNNPISQQRFQTVGRMVKTLLHWTHFAHLRAQERLAGTWPHQKVHFGFDVHAFKAHNITGIKVSDEMRVAMLKPAFERTEEDLKLLVHVVARIPTFQKYSANVQFELGRLLHLESFPEHRVLLKQGDPGTSFYFILSGAVWVVVLEKPLAGFPADAFNATPHMVNQLEKGDVFGELGIHNAFAVRQATIVTKGDTNELLRVDKAEFDSVLQLALRKEYETILTFLTQHPILQKVPASSLSELAAASQMRTYKAHSIIMEADEPFEYIYFILSGQARLVRNVTLGSTPSPNPRSIDSYTPPPRIHSSKVSSKVSSGTSPLTTTTTTLTTSATGGTATATATATATTVVITPSDHDQSSQHQSPLTSSLLTQAPNDGELPNQSGSPPSPSSKVGSPGRRGADASTTTIANNNHNGSTNSLRSQGSEFKSSSATRKDMQMREYLIASGFLCRGNHFAPWLSKLMAVADQRTVCLLIPRLALFKVPGVKVLEELRSTQESADVTDRQIADKFLAKAEWDQTRHLIYQETASRLNLKMT